MENASKALLMAGGVLIGILVLTIAVYLFINFGGTSAKVHEQIQQTEISKFNVQFTEYTDREDVTIYDVITVANLAKENNQYYELNTTSRNKESDLYVAVSLKKPTGTYFLENIGKDEIKEYIAKEELNVESGLPKYTCKTHISLVTGRVYKVDFIQK